MIKKKLKKGGKEFDEVKKRTKSWEIKKKCKNEKNFPKKTQQNLKTGKKSKVPKKIKKHSKSNKKNFKKTWKKIK